MTVRTLSGRLTGNRANVPRSGDPSSFDAPVVGALRFAHGLRLPTYGVFRYDGDHRVFAHTMAIPSLLGPYLYRFDDGGRGVQPTTFLDEALVDHFAHGPGHRFTRAGAACVVLDPADVDVETVDLVAGLWPDTLPF